MNNSERETKIEAMRNILLELTDGRKRLNEISGYNKDCHDIYVSAAKDLKERFYIITTPATNVATEYLEIEPVGDELASFLQSIVVHNRAITICHKLEDLSFTTYINVVAKIKDKLIEQNI